MASAQARSKYMRGVFLGTFALGFGIAAWNYAFGGKDKDKRAYFDKLPEWTRGKTLALELRRDGAASFPPSPKWATRASHGTTSRPSSSARSWKPG
jgi:hypothetical protein